MLSSCYVVMPLLCEYDVIALLCRYVFMLLCGYALMLLRGYVVMFSCCYVVMLLLCYVVVMLLCFYVVVMLLCCCVIISFFIGWLIFFGIFLFLNYLFVFFECFDLCPASAPGGSMFFPFLLLPPGASVVPRLGPGRAPDPNMVQNSCAE